MVDDVSYRWMIRDNGDHYILAVQHSSGGGHKLIIPFHGVGWRADLPVLEVTPKIVQQFIREGIRQGWVYDAVGNPSTFEIGNADALLEEYKAG